jgi:hypothetical protein
MIQEDSYDWPRHIHAARLLLSLLVFLQIGCQSEVEPGSVSATVVAYGAFEIQSGLPTLTSTTSKIQCEAGRIFGVDYRIDVANGEYGIVPVEFRWIHPELAVPSQRLWGRESSARRPNPKLAWRESSLSGRALWTLEHPDELVSGEYEFQIRSVPKGKVLLTRTFDVIGC